MVELCFQIWQKWKNESGFRPPLCTYRLNWARRTSWGWWDDWDDTVLQTQDSKFDWGRARYLSVTQAPHNTNFHTWMGKKHFCFFQTAETGNRTPNSGVKGSGANHYPRAPALSNMARYINEPLQTRGTNPLLAYCWTIVCDAGPILSQLCVNSRICWDEYNRKESCTPSTVHYNRV